MDYYSELAQEQYDSKNTLEVIKWAIRNSGFISNIFYTREIDLTRICEYIAEDFMHNLRQLTVYQDIFTADWNNIIIDSKSLWVNGGRKLIIEPFIKLQASFRRRFVIQKWIRTFNEHNFYGWGF
jgi:hypothetical protein